MSLKDKGNITTAMKKSKVVVPDGVSFDGVSDSLSISADLVGSIDTNTLTICATVYPTQAIRSYYLYSGLTSMTLSIEANLAFEGIFKDAAGTVLLQFGGVVNAALDGFYTFIISVDLANTANRYVYVNDVLSNVTWVTYVDGLMDFTDTIGIGSGDATYPFKGRLSHIFLDYTYRDLSIVANRRLFITADGKPAGGLETLNPILYLPMKDKVTAHLNSGTGGDFVQNGLIETADRGATQDNCVQTYNIYPNYVANDPVFSTTTTSITFSLNMILPIGETQTAILLADSATGIDIFCESTGVLYIKVYNQDGVIAFGIQVGVVPAGRLLSIQGSFDSTDPAKWHLLINGKDYTAMPWTTIYGVYADHSSQNLNIGVGSTDLYIGNKSIGGEYSIGEVYVDTNYINLVTNNPFYDIELNRPISVKKAIADNGLNPLVAMPMSSDNPTLNLGSVGAFTRYGTDAYIGNRGASEYISRGIGPLASTADNLIRDAALIGATDGKLFSCFFTIYSTTGGDIFGFNIGVDNKVRVQCSSTTVQFVAFDASATLTVNVSNAGGALVLDAWNTVFMSIDMTSAANSYIIINNVVDIVSGTPFDNVDLLFGSSNRVAVGSYPDTAIAAANNLASAVGVGYFTQNYIDFSQESNRNLFVNQLGYPRDLTPLIADSIIPTPSMYMLFDDTANLGKNLGTGGDFAVNGTVTTGSDFTI